MIKFISVFFVYLFFASPAHSISGTEKYNEIIFNSCKGYLEYLVAEENQHIQGRRRAGAIDGPCIGYLKAALDISETYGKLLKTPFCIYENKTVEKKEGFDFSEKIKFDEIIPHYVVFMNLLKGQELPLSPLYYVELSLSKKFPCKVNSKEALLNSQMDEETIGKFCEQYFFYNEGGREDNIYSGICRGYFMALVDFNNHKTEMMDPLFCFPKKMKPELSDIVYGYTDYLTKWGPSKKEAKTIEKIVSILKWRFPCTDKHMQKLINQHRKEK